MTERTSARKKGKLKNGKNLNDWLGSCVQNAAYICYCSLFLYWVMGNLDNKCIYTFVHI